LDINFSLHGERGARLHQHIMVCRGSEGLHVYPSGLWSLRNFLISLNELMILMILTKTNSHAKMRSLLLTLV